MSTISYSLVPWMAVSLSTVFAVGCTGDPPAGGAQDHREQQKQQEQQEQQEQTDIAKEAAASSPRFSAATETPNLVAGYAGYVFGVASVRSNSEARLHAWKGYGGPEISEQVTWSTSSPAIVTVSNEPGRRGTIVGHEPGIAVVHVDDNGQGTDVKVLVTLLDIQYLTVSVEKSTVAPGHGTPLVAKAILTDQTQVDVSAAVKWRTYYGPAVEVVQEGLVFKAAGRAWGQTQIEASLATPSQSFYPNLFVSVAPGAGDEDHDGYFAEDDCDDLDPSRSPGAPEIRDNGKDDNCNGAIDEACSNGVVCSRVLPPAGVSVSTSSGSSGWTVSGTAEPNTVVTLRDVSVDPPRLSNINVDATGHFTKSGLATQLAILQVAKAGSAPSGKIWAFLGKPEDVAPPPVAKSIAFQALDARTMTVSGTIALHAVAQVSNLSLETARYAQVVTSGFAPAFRATLQASAGDWVRVSTSYGYANASVMQIPGIDTRPPASPTLTTDVTDPYYPRLWGHSEARSTVYVRDTRTGRIFQTTASDQGQYMLWGIPPGDFVIAWANDGTQDSTKTTATVGGYDTTPPVAATELATTRAIDGKAVISGRVEIGAHVVIINNGNSYTANSTWSGTDEFATFEATIPARGGDVVSVYVLDSIGNAGPSQSLWVPAAGDIPPDPRPSLEYQSTGNPGWRLSGTAQPNAILRAYNASARTSLGDTVVTDPAGAFTISLSTSDIQTGDIILAWVDAGGHESQRSVLRADSYLVSERAPLAPLDVVASPSIDGITILSGRSEIDGTVQFSVDLDPVSSTGDVLWSAASTDTLGTFYAAVAAPPGATVHVIPLDWQKQVGPATDVLVPAPDPESLRAARLRWMRE